MQLNLRVMATVLLFLNLWGASLEDKSVVQDKKGSFAKDNTYSNPALGMTIALPGSWHFFERAAQEKLGVAKEPSPAEEGCPGPFCKNLEIEVALISNSLNGAVFLDAYKLTPQYLDRRVIHSRCSLMP